MNVGSVGSSSEGEGNLDKKLDLRTPQERVSTSSARVSPLNPPTVGFKQVAIGTLAVAGIAIGIFGILAFYNRQPFAQWSSKITQFINDKMRVGQLVSLGNTVVPISSMVIGGVGCLAIGGLFFHHVVKKHQYDQELQATGTALTREGLSARRVMWASTALAASLIAGLLITSYVLGVKGKTSLGQWMQQGLARYNWLPLAILPGASVATLTAIFATFKALHSKTNVLPSQPPAPSKYENANYETDTQYCVED